MKDMLVGQDWMPANSVQKCLEHPLPSCNHGRIFLRFRLLDCIIANRLLQRDWRYDERRVQFSQVST